MPAKGRNKLTPKQIEIGVNEYIKDCKTNNKVPLIIDFALKMGISHDTVADYRNNRLYERSIKRLDNEQESGLLNKGLNENKPVFPIFLLKSKFGYQETSKMDITTNGQSLGVVQLPSKTSENPNK